MMPKPFLLSIVTILTVVLLAVVGCDELVTQVNNNNVYDPTTGQQCVKCHGDDDILIRQPLGQWENSRHASSEFIEAHVRLNGEIYLTSTCGPRCHTSEGYKKFVGGSDTAKVVAKPSVIDCFTCHLPHTGTYGDWKMDTLRGDQETIDLGNFTYFGQHHSTMCAVCHQARHIPIFSSTPGRMKLDSIGADGPHFSAQANLVVGSGGALFGATPDTSRHYSTTVDTTNGSCITCHFGAGTGNGQGYDFGEHTFRLLDHTTGVGFVENCNISQCHDGTPAIVSAVFDSTNIKLDSIRMLGDSLRDKLLAYPILTGEDSDSTEFNSFAIVPTDAGKILFNYLLYKKDGSRGVHNINYMLQLLRESYNRWGMVPKARIFASDTLSCTGVPITFTDSSYGDIQTYAWDFDDGTTETIDTLGIRHTFAKAGTFNVTLTISGDAGIDVAIARVVIDTISVPAFAIVDDTVLVGDTVKFNDLSTPVPSSWFWSFGNGDTSVVQSPRYVYAAPDTFTVWLKIANACGVDSIADTVVVNAPAAQIIGKK